MRSVSLSLQSLSRPFPPVKPWHRKAGVRYVSSLMVKHFNHYCFFCSHLQGPPSNYELRWCYTVCITRSQSQIHKCSLGFPDLADHDYLLRISTAIPSADLAEYRSYGSRASAWWSTHSSRLADLQDECPNTWETAKSNKLGSEIWLNATIALAGCVTGENLWQSTPTPVKESGSTLTDTAWSKWVKVGGTVLLVAVLMLWNTQLEGYCGCGKWSKG